MALPGMRVTDLLQLLKLQVSSDVATKLRIIYGGSVNDKNANELASQVCTVDNLVSDCGLRFAISS